MKFSIEGFQQQALVDFGLDAIDTIIIRWFADFTFGGKMKEIRHDEKSYWWLSYQYLIDELPIIGIENKENIGRRFKKYKEKGVMESHMVKSEGTRTYFRIKEDAWNYLNRLESRVRDDSKVESRDDSKVESYSSISDSSITDSIQSPSAPVALADPKPSKDPLYQAIFQAFIARNGDHFGNYGKEGKAIHRLIAKARDRSGENAPQLMEDMIKKFLELKSTGDHFWKSQPIVPSALDSLWDRVFEKFRKSETLIDPEVMRIIREVR